MPKLLPRYCLQPFKVLRRTAERLGLRLLPIRIASRVLEVPALSLNLG
jgi:hypothetical protein